MVREASTLVVLAAASWLADVRWAGRIGSFLLLFGIWDLTYYGVLKLVLGWPPSLATWDILFLIPLPWIAPVWAPIAVAALFVGAGNHLFWTANRVRVCRLTDAAVLFASACAVVAAFLGDWRIAAGQQVPQRFHAWLFWAGVVAGSIWFVRVELRHRRVDVSNTSRDAVGVVPSTARDTAGKATCRGRQAKPHGRADLSARV